MPKPSTGIKYYTKVPRREDMSVSLQTIDAAEKSLLEQYFMHLQSI